MTDFNQPAGVATVPTTASATAVAAQAAASLIHSASQINELSGFSSLAQVCQYGSQFPTLSADHTNLYGTGSTPVSNPGGGLDLGASAASPVTPVSSSNSASGLSASPGGISSFGFTQEQVACVCEVLEQSQNIDRLAR